MFKAPQYMQSEAILVGDFEPKALKLWCKLGGLAVRPNYKFDAKYYSETYSDVRSDDIDLLKHFEDMGSKEGRLPNRYSHAILGASKDFDDILSSLVIEPELRSLLLSGDPEAHELAYELLSLGDPIDKTLSNFSAKQYCSTYKDIEKAGVDPLWHFLRTGHAEKRVTLADIRANVTRGGIAFDVAKRTCLICSHELSRTGAPSVALDIVREASATQNVIVMALRGGTLMKAFREASCMVIISPQPYEDWDYFPVPELFKIEFAILNSVEAFPFIKPLVSANLPFASYIHEFADYVLPTYKGMLTTYFANRIVFSSAAVRESWSGFLADAKIDIARDTGLLSQAALVFRPAQDDLCRKARKRISSVLGVECGNRRIVYGAGQMQIRKGTDLFVMVAQQVRRLDPDTMFVWIGDGANHEDIEFGVWLDKHLREGDANSPEGNLFVIPAGPSYFDLSLASDVLFLPSRLDPLPNVVFDAAQNGCTVVLFKGATGFDDALYDSCPSIVRIGYCDLDASAHALMGAARKLSGQLYGDTGTAAKTAPLALFDRIHRMIPQLPDGAPAAHDVSVLFHDDTSKAADARQHERARLARLGRRAIWPNVETARRTMAAEGGWVHARSLIEPHRDIAVDDPVLADLPPFRVHVHAHYLDDLERDIATLAAYRLAAQVIATTDTYAKAAKIESYARAAGFPAEVRVIENQGRDILPFLRVIDGHPSDDDAIWCHIHQKKSITSASGGDVWRNFLLRILMGDDANVSSAVQRIARPGTGLVTAFDPYVVGWAGSRRLLPEVERRLGRSLPDAPLLFPIGNMFWTRAVVARKMLGIFGKNYPWPNEPLPNDGTVYHMIERLWPAVTMQAGLETVFLDRPKTRRV